jgi:hypothetical protein
MPHSSDFRLPVPFPPAGIYILGKIVRVSKDAVVRGMSLLCTVMIIGYQMRLKMSAVTSLT